MGQSAEQGGDYPATRLFSEPFKERHFRRGRHHRCSSPCWSSPFKRSDMKILQLFVDADSLNDLRLFARGSAECRTGHAAAFAQRVLGGLRAARGTAAAATSGLPLAGAAGP